MANLFCQCSYKMRILKNGVRIVDRDREDIPVAIYNTDAWKCPICGHVVFVGANKPSLEPHNKGFWPEVTLVLAELKEFINGPHERDVQG